MTLKISPNIRANLKRSGMDLTYPNIRANSSFHRQPQQQQYQYAQPPQPAGPPGPPYGRPPPPIPSNSPTRKSISVIFLIEGFFLVGLIQVVNLHIINVTRTRQSFSN